MDISVFSSMLSVTLKTDRRREGRKLRQYLAALSATIGPFAVGTILAWTSPVMPKLVRNETMALNGSMALNGTMEFEGPSITAEEGSWIGSIIAIGAIFGSLPASWGADFIGRKYAIASLAIPFVISWLMVMFGESVLMLMIARFIGGGVIGAVTATIPMYIGEIAEVSIRGELGSYIQLMVTLGIFYVYVIGPFVSYFVLNLCCLAVPVVFAVLFLIVAPETPLYLLRKNKRKEAERSLIILRGPDYDIVGELDEIQEQIDEEKKRKQSFAVLFTSRAVIRATIAVMGLLSFLSFSGINVVIFYAQEIFQAGGTQISPEWSAIIIGGMQVVMTYASGLLVDRAGRRVLLLVSDSVMAVCLFALGAFFWAKESQYDISDISWVPLVSLSVYISVFSLGFGPIPGIMMGELFSPEAKGVALGIVCILASVLEFFVVKGFHPLAHHLGMAWTITIFGINCLLGTLFVWFLVPETKNKSLQQIQDELSGKAKRGKKKNRNSKNGNAGNTKKRIVINSASANNVNNMMV